MQDNGLSIDDVGRLLLTTREAFALVQSAFGFPGRRSVGFWICR